MTEPKALNSSGVWQDKVGVRAKGCHDGWYQDYY